MMADHWLTNVELIDPKDTFKGFMLWLDFILSKGWTITRFSHKGNFSEILTTTNPFDASSFLGKEVWFVLRAPNGSYDQLWVKCPKITTNNNSNTYSFDQEYSGSYVQIPNGTWNGFWVAVSYSSEFSTSQIGLFEDPITFNNPPMALDMLWIGSKNIVEPDSASTYKATSFTQPRDFDASQGFVGLPFYDCGLLGTYISFVPGWGTAYNPVPIPDPNASQASTRPQDANRTQNRLYASQPVSFGYQWRTVQKNSPVYLHAYANDSPPFDFWFLTTQDVPLMWFGADVCERSNKKHLIWGILSPRIESHPDFVFNTKGAEPWLHFVLNSSQEMEQSDLASSFVSPTITRGSYAKASSREEFWEWRNSGKHHGTPKALDLLLKDHGVPGFYSVCWAIHATEREKTISTAVRASSILGVSKNFTKITYKFGRRLDRLTNALNYEETKQYLALSGGVFIRWNGDEVK
jgi:hypothetical protein